MLTFLSPIVFTQPVILTALLALPVLWYILRITPPAPKKVTFPPARFLADLIAEEQTPDKSPWWLLLLRMLLIALIITALAQPVINPADSLSGKGAIRIIMGNSWASAPTWNTQSNAAEEIITQAAREGREIYIMPTTATLGETSITQFGPLSQREALSVIRGLKPNSWPADYKAMIDEFRNKKTDKSIDSIWLSHGLNEGNLRSIITAAQSDGSLTYIKPKEEKTALLLRPTKKALRKSDSDIRIDIEAAVPLQTPRPATIQALSTNGNILDLQTITITDAETPQTIPFEIADTLQNDISRFKISGQYGAGGIYLLDDNAKKRSVGIAASEQDLQKAPLIESSYYITRALEPYANISTGKILELIEKDSAVIVLPDIAAMPTETLNKLEKWVSEGGLLLRFAGPNTADSLTEPFLMPVTLRAGGRSLSGSLSWDEPQTIKQFAENSPFFGLEIPQGLEIKQQVLADPSQELEGKIWAELTDGTPFITTTQKDKGLIVLVHTTANTDWSNFSLSGLYVSILRKTIALAGQSSNQINTSYKNLEPALIMDGFGALNTPAPSVKPLPLDKLDQIKPNSLNPPGIYGSGSKQYALNLGANLPRLQITENLPISVIQNQYESDYELDLMPYILYAALCLFLIDWLLMIFLLGSTTSILKKRGMATFLFALLALPENAHAQSQQQHIQFASGFYLAHIKTGDAALDSLTMQGLSSLSETLERRTSIEPKGVIGLNPERDALAFFPLIYWPISPNQKPVSDKAIQNIQNYLNHGGTILFDTRDQNRSTTSVRNTPNAQMLRNITSRMNIPPIMRIPDNHVLGRSFYLLDDYPGQYKSGTLWIEQQSAAGRDGVSSIIIGSNDWANAWANASQTGINRKYEMSLRFGVNLVMYALTGNYKADQVHIPHILKRLDK